MSRHYSEQNKYPTLNSRYSTLHLQQYLTDNEINHFEKLVSGKIKPKHRMEQSILDLWDDNLPLRDYCERITSNIKQVNKVVINAIERVDDDLEVRGTVTVTTKEAAIDDQDKFVLDVVTYINKDAYYGSSPACVRLTYVDIMKIKDKIVKEVEKSI